MSITTIKPIETIYHGRKFRSRLEARWAVFLDDIGANWEYEPEGYNLGDGLYYLPDFLVHNVVFKRGEPTHNLFIEVKGVLSYEDLNKIDAFKGPLCDDYTYLNPIVAFGQIPIVDSICEIGSYVDKRYDWERTPLFSFNNVLADCYIAYLAKGKDGEVYLSGEDYGEYIDNDATIHAYKKASMARFEHGENK